MLTGVADFHHTARVTSIDAATSNRFSALCDDCQGMIATSVNDSPAQSKIVTVAEVHVNGSPRLKPLKPVQKRQHGSDESIDVPQSKRSAGLQEGGASKDPINSPATRADVPPPDSRYAEEATMKDLPVSQDRRSSMDLESSTLDMEIQPSDSGTSQIHSCEGNMDTNPSSPLGSCVRVPITASDPSWQVAISFSVDSSKPTHPRRSLELKAQSRTGKPVSGVPLKHRTKHQ